MATKLYTAAEARRIDIERGGEGVVYTFHNGDRVDIRFHEETKLWEDCSNLMIFWSPVVAFEVWQPMTPEPEQGSISDIKMLARNCFLDGSISAREAESISILCDEVQNILNAHKQMEQEKEQLEKELAELKEKQMSKVDYQILHLGRLILEVNRRAWALREADL